MVSGITMKDQLYFLFALLLTLFSCQKNDHNKFASFEVFCEMVANDAKPIALSHPMTSAELQETWDDYQEIAQRYDVSLFREKDFPVTLLFPSSATDGKEVVVIYRGSRLIQFKQFKEDLPDLEPEAAARRFGRLLGYTSQGINRLLMGNIDFRTLESFGVRHQVTHLYYQDLKAGHRFYGETLGLPLDENLGYKIGESASIKLHPYEDSHPQGQSKSTAIALLTDQLPEWYKYLQEQKTPIKYTYKRRDGGPHDGFVAIDPEGYLLEFEQFKQHPENELFMATLENAVRVPSKVDSLNFYGSITWTYHNDLLEMQQFYEEVLGFSMVADQGWTKIYQTSSAGYIGLVDERRGMMDYADEKAVEIEWRLDSAQQSKAYFSQSTDWDTDLRGLRGPEYYFYLLR